MINSRFCPPAPLPHFPTLAFSCAASNLRVHAPRRQRSHERFMLLPGHVTDARLSKIYVDLAEAEARHGPVYLDLAIAHAGEEATKKRLDELLDVEARALSLPPKAEISVHGTA